MAEMSLTKEQFLGRLALLGEPLHERINEAWGRHRDELESEIPGVSQMAQKALAEAAVEAAVALVYESDSL